MANVADLSAVHTFCIAYRSLYVNNNHFVEYHEMVLLK